MRVHLFTGNVKSLRQVEPARRPILFVHGHCQYRPLRLGVRQQRLANAPVLMLRRDKECGKGVPTSRIETGKDCALCIYIRF